MTQRLTLFSQEIEDFVLELKIDADATFLDLHNLIQDACDYQDRHNHSFLICDEEWRVKNHIRQTDDQHVAIDEDTSFSPSAGAAAQRPGPPPSAADMACRRHNDWS